MPKSLMFPVIGCVLAFSANAFAIEGGILENLATVPHAKSRVAESFTDTTVTFHGRTAKTSRACSVEIWKRDQRETLERERGLVPFALWSVHINSGLGPVCDFSYDSLMHLPTFRSGFSLIRGIGWELRDESLEFSRWDNFAGPRGRPQQEYEFIKMVVRSPTTVEAHCDDLPENAYRSMKDGCLIDVSVDSAR